MNDLGLRGCSCLCIAPPLCFLSLLEARRRATLAAVPAEPATTGVLPWHDPRCRKTSLVFSRSWSGLHHSSGATKWESICRKLSRARCNNAPTEFGLISKVSAISRYSNSARYRRQNASACCLGSSTNAWSSLCNNSEPCASRCGSGRQSGRLAQSTGTGSRWADIRYRFRRQSSARAVAVRCKKRTPMPDRLGVSVPHRGEKRLLHTIGSIVPVAYQAIHGLPDRRAMVPDNSFPNSHLGHPFRGRHSSSLTLLVAPQPQDSAKSAKMSPCFDGAPSG